MASATSGNLQRIFNYIDCEKNKFIDDLREAVAIPSVSVCPRMRHEVATMMLWLEERFRKVGASTERVAVGMITAGHLPGGRSGGSRGGGEGSVVAEPGAATPALLITYMAKPAARKTVCVYCHGDTRCPPPKDTCAEDPWTLRQEGDYLLGCGVYDNKGPLLSWLHVLEVFSALGLPFPVNLKIVVDGLGALGSPGLTALLHSRRNTFLGDVDFVCVTHGTWLEPDQPCLIYGTRGVCVFDVEISNAERNALSGPHSGAVPEPMVDASLLLSSMVDSLGHVKIEGIRDDVLPVTPEEERIYRSISFSVDKYKNDLGARALLHKGEKSRVLMHRWRFPALSVHCIETVPEPAPPKDQSRSCSQAGPQKATSESSFRHSAVVSDPPGLAATGLIPGKVRTRFSLRIVPNQTTEKVSRLVRAHIDRVWKDMRSVNKIKVTTTLTAEPWYTDPMGVQFQAATRGIQCAYKKAPILIREGSSIPGALVLKEICQKPLLLLPLGYKADDGAAPEALNVRDYMAAPKILVGYLNEIAKLQ